MGVCYIYCSACDTLFAGAEGLKERGLHFCMTGKPDLRVITKEEADRILEEIIERKRLGSD